MAMNVKRVQMMRVDGSRVIGNFYLLPHAEANALIATGAARAVDNDGKPIQTKPVGPAEVKPVAPPQIKK